MKTKSLFVAAILAASSTFALAQTPPATASPAQTPLTAEVKEQVLSGISRVITRFAFIPGHDLSKWDQFIAGEKDGLDKATNDTEFATAIRSALSKFGVSHMVIMTPQAARARVERKTVGIGIQIQPGPEGLRVIHVFENSPAAEAGLEAGDLIFEADGKKLNETSTITGDEGTSLEIKVKRLDKVVPFKLTRKKYSNVRPDTLVFKDADTAILKINTFDLSYDRKKIDELMGKAQTAKNLIVDLRSNGGGAVLNMLHFLGYVLPEDEKFGVFLGKAMVNRYVEETGGDPTDLRKIAMSTDSGWLRATKNPIGPFKGNLAVLINGGSGSASEISAQAMKELRGASVVGSKSAGAVLVSTMAPVSNNWLLQYPLSDYMSAQGVRLEGNGIAPDIEAALFKFGEPDDAVEKAVALLKRAALRNERAKPLLSLR